MKTKSLAFSKIITAGLCLALSNLAFSADLTGTWSLIMELDGGPSMKPGHGWTRQWGERIKLVQTGSEVSGTYRGKFGEARVTGTSTGSDLKLQYEIDMGHSWGEQTISVEYSGTVENDSIQGTVVVNSSGSGRGGVRNQGQRHLHDGKFTGFASTGGSPSELYDELPPDIQEELAKEKEGIVAGCNSNTDYRKFNDCSCVAKKYMDYRISNGSTPDSSMIWMTINKPDTIRECVNETGVAEHFYPICVGNYRDRKSNVERYCKCYADSMAENYRKQPNTSSRNMRKLNLNAVQACGGV